MTQLNLSKTQKRTHRCRELSCGGQGAGGWRWEDLGVWG